MARFYGTIGFKRSAETAPGVWESVITHREYTGDIVHDVRRYSAPAVVNDNLTVTNAIRVIADSYTQEHLSEMAYVTWLGQKWKIQSIEVHMPRLTINLGGLYVETED